MTDLDAGEWARLLDGLDAPSVGDAAEALADYREGDVSAAYHTVEAALDGGVLVETDAGMFGTVEVPGHEDDDTDEDDDSEASEGAEPDEDSTEEGGSPDATPTHEAEGGADKYRRVYLDAVNRAGREPWEFVDEGALREALAAIGFAELLDSGDLRHVSAWRVADVSDADEEPRRRWYYPSGSEPRPDEFRRFHQLLTEAAPEGYEPHYFRVAKAGKDPATQYGSWKTPDARLTVEEAVAWMERGGNVGIAGRPEDALINVDIDDDEATTPEDVPTSLRARSRSRTGWHTWYFDEDGDVPNIPTDEFGEIRTDWQYVVAPGSFVASTSEEIPDDAGDPGCYTVEDEEPVARIGYDDLPDVFHEAAEAAEDADETADTDETVDTFDAGDAPDSGDTSAVFDVEAADLVTESDAGARFGSIFHSSSTGANMSVSKGKLHCWRHGVAHGGLQALATLSDEITEGCRELGAAHKNSGAGRNRLKGDWRLVWAAWHEAKNRAAIPSDDAIPYRALRELAVDDGLLDREDLVERDTDDGGYLGFPDAEAYNAALNHVRDTYDADPGREYADRGEGGEAEHTAVLPTAVRDLTTAASGWDWKHVGRTGADTLTIEDARERTTDAIADAYERRDRVLVEALPTMGKSYGAVKAAADTNEPVTIVTGRGRKEQYDQFKQWCDEHGVSCKELPAFTEDCPTAAGDHGEEWKETVMDWYRRGATPQQIHNRAEYHLNEPLPCQVAEDGTRIECAHRHAWNFNPDDYDVLLGHYTHAYTQQATEGRTVVFDEFPNAYETGLVAMKSAISYWLESTEGVPFEDYTDLIENRDDQQRRGEALLWFEDQGVESDEGHVFEDATAHADAPLAVYTLLAAEGLGNGIERADLGDTGTGVFNRQTTEVSVLRPPALEYASGVVALDGTPTKRMWELALGERLNHRPVLQDEERAEYVRDALNLNLVRTTEHVKPYNSADHVNTDRDAALLKAITEKHGERPSVITTRTALEEYDTAGALDVGGVEGGHLNPNAEDAGEIHDGPADRAKWHGNVLGSNEFDDTRVGAVTGSNHYGDGYIKKWAAYAGEAVDRGDEKGADLSYSGFGDDVLQHMREHDTLQAAMRFGRDGNGAVVYVHTDTLPEWVPVVGEGRVVSTWSDGMRDVVSALEDLTTATTADVVAHPAVDLSRQQVFDHLENLRERGVLQRQQDPEDGRRVVWRDDGLHRLGEHGEVELEPVDLEDLDDDEVRQLARSSSIYTWEFTNLTTKVDATEAEAEHGIAKAPKDGKMYEPSRGRWWTA